MTTSRIPLSCRLFHAWTADHSRTSCDRCPNYEGRLFPWFFWKTRERKAEARSKALWAMVDAAKPHPDCTSWNFRTGECKCQRAT